MTAGPSSIGGKAMSVPVFLAVETGGTKTIARLEGPRGAIAEARWSTTTPDAVLASIVGWTGETLAGDMHLVSAGVAAFGPLVLDPSDRRFGELLATSKPGWTGANLVAGLRDKLGIPVAIDTDVNAAARAELALGAGRGLASLGYLTVGTGIGAGLATEGGTLKGALHPEIGHLRLVRAHGDAEPSSCPFHADCAEGLAAGPAVRRRLGEGVELDERPEIRSLVAAYIADLCISMVLAWSPHRIAIGGGVGAADGMIAAIGAAFASARGDYGLGPAAERPDFIQPAALADAGLEGALLMARETAPAEATLALT